jgi:peptidoglycan/LPS O-acetylase OafA/YrhL
VLDKSAPVRLPGLDTLRAIAILAVMLFHIQWRLPEELRPVAQFGWMGVDLFFVLSGYLIGLQLMKPYGRGEKPSLQEFYRRRAFRILPAYVVVLGLYFLVPGWRESTGLSPLWEFVTFTENLFVDYAKNINFSHVWSLCVEEHFYLVLPVLAVGMMRRPSWKKTVAVLAALVAMGMGIRAYVLMHELRHLDDDVRSLIYIEHMYYPTWNRLDGLMAGVGLALVKVFRPGWWERMMDWGPGLAVGGVVLVGLAMRMFVDRFSSVTGWAAWGSVVGFPVLSVGLGMLVAASVGWRWRMPGAELLATLAFSLYLTHKEMVHVVQGWLPGATAERDLKAMGIYVLACLAGAGVLYLGVERPFLRLRERLDGQVKDGVPEEVGAEPAL